MLFVTFREKQTPDITEERILIKTDSEIWKISNFLAKNAKEEFFSIIVNWDEKTDPNLTITKNQNIFLCSALLESFKLYSDSDKKSKSLFQDFFLSNLNHCQVDFISILTRLNRKGKEVILNFRGGYSLLDRENLIYFESKAMLEDEFKLFFNRL